MIDFNKLIDKHLIREHKPKQVGKYYPSEIGSCIRKTWFSYKKPKEVKAELLRIFEAGNMLHEFIAEVIKSEKNPEVELLEQEMPLKVEDDGFVISGRIDNLVLVKMDNEKILVEVKSIKFLKDYPSEEHTMQLQFYMHAIGVHKGILLYVQKDNLQTKWFNIPYNKAKAEDVVSRFRLLDKCLKIDQIPPPEAKYNSHMEWMCNYCDYREECDKN